MRTLVILPNAIGDVICGIGIAKKFLEDGSVTWIVNSSAAGVLKNEGFELIHSPSKSVQNMNRFGARIETIREMGQSSESASNQSIVIDSRWS